MSKPIQDILLSPNGLNLSVTITHHYSGSEFEIYTQDINYGVWYALSRYVELTKSK
jgi:hypothetical protein